jgi:hypothetical protein
LEYEGAGIIYDRSKAGCLLIVYFCSNESIRPERFTFGRTDCYIKIVSNSDTIKNSPGACFFDYIILSLINV